MMAKKFMALIGQGIKSC